MTERELLTRLYLISGHYDFLVIFKREYNEQNWGEYYHRNKVIVLYVNDENGEQYDDETLVRVSCHELAHHIQFHHIEGYKPVKGEEHDTVFKQEFAKFLKLYYNGRVPQSTLDFIKGEGFANEPNRKKKRKLPSRSTDVC